MNITTILCILMGVFLIYTGVRMFVTKDVRKVNPSQTQYIKKEDLDKFAKKSSIALIIFGSSFVLTGILYFIFNNYLICLILLVGFIIYSTILVTLQMKYNKEPNQQPFDHNL